MDTSTLQVRTTLILFVSNCQDNESTLTLWKTFFSWGQWQE